MLELVVCAHVENYVTGPHAMFRGSTVRIGRRHHAPFAGTVDRRRGRE